jgi:hypothetical protein
MSIRGLVFSGPALSHEVISMLEFFIGSMFVKFEEHIILASLRHPHCNKLYPFYGRSFP